MYPVDDPTVIFGGRAPFQSLLESYIFTISLSFAVFALIVVYLKKQLNHDIHMLKMFNKFPGAKPSPIFGNAGIFMGDPTEIPRKMADYFKTYGRCARFWKMSAPDLMICDPTVIEKILGSPKQIEKGQGYSGVRNYFGQGLVTSNGDKWRQDRKELNAGLKRNLFEAFIESFNTHADRLVDHLRASFGENPSARNIFHDLGNCTLDLICETGLGKPEESDNINGPPIVNAIGAIVSGIRMRVFKPWLQVPIIWRWFGNAGVENNHLKPFQKNVLQYVDKKRKEQADMKSETSYETPPKSILDILLQTESKRSHKEIYDHVVTFLGAGTDTSASCLNYTLYLLALNPHHQQKVQEELDRIFANREGDKSVTMGDLTEMKYLEMCIKESLRIFPPAPVFSRTIQSDIPLDGDDDNKLTIPKGVTAIMWPYFVHRDPDVFPNPETFDPERFTAEASAKRSIYSYIPFSAGIRNCIGHRFAMMEMKVILAHLLSSFTVTTTKPKEELEVIFGIVLEPANGIPMALTPR